MRMIPSVLGPDTQSNAERRLFDLLDGIPFPDDYCCLHSIELPDHEQKALGELDFVIVSERGLYIIEVKGGGISCRNGIWNMRTAGAKSAEPLTGLCGRQGPECSVCATDFSSGFQCPSYPKQSWALGSIPGLQLQ